MVAQFHARSFRIVGGELEIEEEAAEKENTACTFYK